MGLTSCGVWVGTRGGTVVACFGACMGDDALWRCPCYNPSRAK